MPDDGTVPQNDSNPDPYMPRCSLCGRYHYGGCGMVPQNDSRSDPRPRWAEAVRMFIADEVLDEKYGYPMDGEDDWLHGLVEDAVNGVFCRAYGHEIVDDQCMKPEHRFCAYCNRRANVL